MGYVSLRDGSAPRQRSLTPDRLAHIRKLTESPVAIRILATLGQKQPLSQQEIATSLLMTGAAVHYHLKKLKETGLVELVGTRPGPNGITEKLYSADLELWSEVFDAPARQGDLDYYLKYTIAWMHERHREGLELIRRKKKNRPPFIAGSFTVNVTAAEAVELKQKLEAVLGELFETHARSKPGDRASYAVTFSLLPSTQDMVEDSMNALEFEPRRR